MFMFPDFLLVFHSYVYVKHQYTRVDSLYVKTNLAMDQILILINLFFATSPL